MKAQTYVSGVAESIHLFHHEVRNHREPGERIPVGLLEGLSGWLSLIEVAEELWVSESAPLGEELEKTPVPCSFDLPQVQLGEP